MHQPTAYPLVKKMMIESQSPNGRCYLRMIPLIRNFGQLSASSLEDIIMDMSVTLGANPLGVDVLKSLYHADSVASGEIDSGIAVDIDDLTIPTNFIEHLMSSPVRFGFEELNGVLHVTYYMISSDPSDSGEDSPVQSEFGWAARFIIQQMCNAGKRIGADDELDNLFGSILAMPQQELNHKDPKLYSSDDEIRETQARVEDIYNRMERNQAHAVPQFKPDENAELKERIMRMEERMQSMLSIKEQSVLPDDSSSNNGRYKKRFMPNGYTAEPPMSQIEESFEGDEEFQDVQPVYVMSKGKTVLSVGNTIMRPNIVKNVAVGFRKTNDMTKTENQILSTIHPINGLANPFKSNRLNLLVHFHTAISNILPKYQDEDYIRMMWHMSKYKSTTPSEELAFQIVTKTFNLSENNVVANPFKLPFIEVGMQINDPTIIKCFRMLKSEYEQLWFEEMKHLWVPEFHNSFHQYVEGKLTPASQHSESNQSSRRRDSIIDDTRTMRSPHSRGGHYERKRSKGNGSLLSMRSDRY